MRLCTRTRNEIVAEPLSAMERQRIQERLGRSVFCGCECSEWYAEDVGRLVRLTDQEATRVRTLERQMSQHLRDHGEAE